MTFRLRTAWLEIAAGFHLLSAAAAAHFPRAAAIEAHGGIPRGLMSTLLLLAACAVFLLHPSRTSRIARRLLFLFAGTVTAAGAWWAFADGAASLGFLQAGFAAWLLSAAAFPWCDQQFAAVGEARPRGLQIVLGSALLCIGLHGLTAGASSAWHAAPAAALAVLAGAGSFAVEILRNARLRLAGSVAAALGYLCVAAPSFQASGYGEGGAMIFAAAFLIVSALGDGGLPEAADDLAGATPRQREIYAYERGGELTLWAVAALSAAFINFIGPFDARLYFVAMFVAAFFTQYSYRLRPSTAISERRYMLTLAAVVAASIVLIAATGGALGPFAYVAYLAVFAGAVIIRPVWSIAVASAYAAYFLAELLAQLGAAHGVRDAHVAQYLFLTATIVFTGLYTAWTGRRRVRTDEALIAANRRLAEALRTAVRERERYERQAQDLKILNDDLLEMRSALMNVLEDVEESKRQIEVERRRESASLEALAEGVVAAGKDGRIFLCNPMAARILGVAAESVIGEPVERVLRLFREEGDVLQTHAFEEAYAGRTAPLGDRLRLSRTDGGTVPVSGNVAPYLDEDGRTGGVVVAFRDVTIEREIDRQKSDFISIASHQLRTPLSAMRWFLDLLLGGDAGALKPQQREYLADMSASVARMVKLVGDLLNISRIESGRVKPVPSLIATAGFTESIVKEFEPLVKQQGVKFSFAVAKDAAVFYADPNLARQAVSNVLSNAVKYTPPGGEVALDARVQDGQTVFRIRDTGVGIPKPQQYRIFDKFFRSENVISRETVGSGLGLYVVKTIMDLSGGRAWFESAENAGTTFYLAFPNDPKDLPAEDARGTMAA